MFYCGLLSSPLLSSLKSCCMSLGMRATCLIRESFGAVRMGTWAQKPQIHFSNLCKHIRKGTVRVYNTVDASFLFVFAVCLVGDDVLK